MDDMHSNETTDAGKEANNNNNKILFDDANQWYTIVYLFVKKHQGQNSLGGN